MIVYAGQNKDGNWVWMIDPSDPTYHNIKTIEWKPKTIEQIEQEYGLKVSVE
jgi:hypothetical protein